MSAVVINKDENLEKEYQRDILTMEGKKIQAKDLYATGKSSIDSCVTEMQFASVLRLIFIIEKIDVTVSTALYYYYRVKTAQLQEL